MFMVFASSSFTPLAIYIRVTITIMFLIATREREREREIELKGSYLESRFHSIKSFDWISF